MDFFSTISNRYSVRAYQNRPVEKEKLQQVLEAARLAPTAVNKQPFRLVVMNTRGHEQELNRVYHREWFVQAPLVICICTMPAEAWNRRDGKNYADVDATIAMDHLILSATELGLGTCWIGAFDPAAAKQVFALAPGWEPLIMTPLGYPADQPRLKTRKPLTELVNFIE